MERDDTIGGWSVDKLNLLRKYLQAYVTVLRKQSWCKGYEYIDGFAGTGKPKSRDEQRYVEGSPRVALELPHPFTKYHLFESSDWRVKKLEKLRKEFSSRQVEIYPGDCNEVLRTRIVPQPATEQLQAGYRVPRSFRDGGGMKHSGGSRAS